MASPFAPNCTAAFPDGSSATVNAQYHFVIQSYDVTGTIITVDNANYIASTSGASPPVTFVQPVYTGSGTYTGSFDASTTGTVTLHIKLTNQGPDEEIGPSPFTITVGPQVPYAPNSTVTFPDGPSGTTNTDYHFVIQAVTQDGTLMTTGGFTFTATVSPSGTVTGPVDNSNGTYSGSFNASTVGTFLLSIQYSSVDVSGSPFSIPINAQVADPGHTTASGPGVDGGTHILHPAPFTVVTRDSSNNPLTTGGTAFTVSVTHGTYHHPFSFVDNSNGTYSGSYTPFIPIGPWTVTIQIGGTNIVGSPFHPVFLL